MSKAFFSCLAPAAWSKRLEKQRIAFLASQLLWNKIVSILGAANVAYGFGLLGPTLMQM